jgi:LysM repeat protein
MRRRSMLGFVILNVLVSLAVVLVVINVVNQNSPERQPQQAVITVVVVHTATLDPQATTPFMIITATPRPGEAPQIDLPPGIVDDPTAAAAAVETNLTAAVAPTLDPTILGEGGDLLASTVTALPPNCVLHALKEGEFPGSVAEQYNVSVFDLLSVNGLTDEDAVFLQIGQVLIVPLEGCPLLFAPTLEAGATETAVALTPTDTPTITGTPPTATLTPSASPPPTNTPTPSLTPSLSPTPTRTPLPTLPPTAVNSRMQIVTVENPGDVTAECVVIRNNGATVDLNNWSVRDSQGSRYTFQGQFLVFERGEVRLCSGVGGETPIRRQWGQQSAVWESGDTVVLSDGQGNAQATYSVP